MCGKNGKKFVKLKKKTKKEKICASHTIETYSSSGICMIYNLCDNRSKPTEQWSSGFI
jgi:hypothetical protein